VLPDGTLTADLRDEVLLGLGKQPKSLSCKFFYDQRGSELFERICDLPEYYLTRTEQTIMRASIGAIARSLGPRCLVIEYGSGNSTKTTFLLEHLQDPVGYVPIDISRPHLREAARRLKTRFPDLDVMPIWGDFHQDIPIPEATRPERRRVVYFPGSTIGNLEEDDARVFLDHMADMVGADGGVLIGIDRRKAEEVLVPAYDDADGVTAEFNLNMLARINHDLGADFVLEQYRHEAIWNDEQSRMEMYLVSRCAQTVTVGGERFQFDAGERICTEYSHKYTLEQFGRIASAFVTEGHWTDTRDWFSVLLLRPRGDDDDR
jgi:dimethylhistidine N-methyltransferase